MAEEVDGIRGRTSPKDEQKAKGGRARAQSLSPERRSEIARKAAEAKHRKPARKATHTGTLTIGDLSIPCAVLDDGTRVLSRRDVSRALGAAAPGGRRSDDDELPSFLSANNVKPFVDKDLSSSASRPIVYRRQEGGIAYGMDARLIPKVCEVWLRVREGGKLHRTQDHIAAKAELLMRGLAHVGIIALVDEATGYQQDRDRDALHRILEAYIAKELLPWAKRFPDEFYAEMFRLQGWQYRPMTAKRPVMIGKRTNEIVYKRLPEGVLSELVRLNPKNEKGRRRHKHHQFLTEDVGHPHLMKHIVAVTTLMRISPNWKVFKKHLDKAIPLPGQGDQGNLFPELDEDDEE